MNTYGEINGEDVDNGIYLFPNRAIKIFYPFGGHLNAITGQYPGGSLFEYKTAQNGWLGMTDHSIPSCLTMQTADT